MRKILRRPDRPCEPAAFKHPDEHPAGISLTRQQTELCRARKRVVVVVPTLAHAEPCCDGNVVTLHAGAHDVPAHRAAAVCEVTYQPVAGDGDADASADSPHHPAPASN